MDRIYFSGDAPSIHSEAFYNVYTDYVTLCYHAGTNGWTAVSLGSQVVLEAVEHICFDYTYDNNHTCTVDGTERGICLVCGETDIRRVEGTADHWMRYISNGDATCTENGTSDGVCMLCGFRQTVPELGSATGHAWSEYASNGDATCTTDGTKTATCGNCGLTMTAPDEGSATGHSWSEYASNGDATCTTDGTKTATCGNCGLTMTAPDEGSATGHSWSEYASNGDATCTTDGTKTATCGSCGLVETVADEGSALGHSFTQYVYENNHTCTVNGTETATCDRCQATDWRFVPGTADHRYFDGACMYCGIVEETCETVGHTWSAYVSNGDATCTADGTKTAVCSKCGAEDTVTDEGTMLQHSFTNYVYDNNHTCTRDGTETAQCDYCSSKAWREVPGTAAHRYEDGVCLHCGETEEPVPDCLTYSIVNGKVAITGCDETASGELIIPETIRGYPVTCIEFGAFENCSSLTDVTIPQGVTEIRAWAFENCSSLTNVTIPDGVTAIGYGAFSGCSSLTHMAIPEGITEIEGYVFHGCTDLTTVIIPNTVSSIGYFTFAGCSSLTGVTIPEGVTIIDSYAFENCSSLTDVTLPDGIIDVGNGAFSGCSGVAYNSYDEGLYLGNAGNPYLVLMDTENTWNSSIIIHPQTKIIGGGAFQYCGSLTSLEIPDSVVTVGSFAFSDCSSLTGLTLPDSVTQMGNSVFSGCTSLVTVTLPKAITRFGESMFYGCTSLTSVVLPQGVTHIGEGTFGSCTSLTGVTLPDSITAISMSAFSDCRSLTNLTIPAGVTSVWDYAFSRCTNLVNIYFVGNAPEWGSSPFSRTFASVWYHTGTTGWENVTAEDLTGNVGSITLREVPHICPEYTYDNNHTCTADGTERAVCLTCGETDIRTAEGTGGHRYVDGVCTVCGVAEVTTCFLKGSLTAFGEGDTLLEATAVGENEPVASLLFWEDTYLMEQLQPGEYVLTASKEGCVTRSYTVTIDAGENLLDIKLHQPGDVNGDGRLNVGDVVKIYGHIKNASLSNDAYGLLCADYNGDGRVNVGDTARLYALIKG